MTFSNNSVTMLCNDTSGKCTEEATENAEVWRTLMAVYLGAILFLSLAFNGTLCLMFYKKSHLLSVSNCFVLNLICCQLCMCLLVLPFSLFAVVSQDLMYSGHWCEIQGFFFTSVIVAQQLALLIISIDRNYAIMNSLRYPNVFTQTLCSVLIAFAWTCAVIVSIPPLIGSGVGNFVFHPSQFLCGLDWAKDMNYLVVFSLTAFAFPVLIQSFCYIKIFIAAVGHSKRSSKVKPWASRPSRATSELRSDSSTCSSDYSEELYQTSVECKAVKTIFIIALAYSVCWVPYFIDSFLTMNGVDVNPNFSAAAICCLFSSSIFNPMIYAYMNRVTRREIGRFVCGNSGMNDSDEAGSTSMSAYSAWAQSKIRSKSNGAMTNEMDTIMEETEVEESVFCEPRSDNRLNISHCKSRTTVMSPTTSQSNRKEKVNLKQENCFHINGEEKFEKELKVPATAKIISPETPGSHLEQNPNANRKKQRESAWNIIKTEKFNEELRRSSKSSESYFAKGKRRRKRDCGSFLYFENNNEQSEARVNRKRERDKGVTHRYSVDHIQSISVGRIPNLMKFQLSLNESDLRNINKVTVKSDFKFENEAFENEEDSHLTEHHPPGSSAPHKNITRSKEQFHDGLPEPGSLENKDLNIGLVNANQGVFTPKSHSLVTKPLVSQTVLYKHRVTQIRVKSAPAVLSSRHTLNTKSSCPPVREASTSSLSDSRVDLL